MAFLDEKFDGLLPVATGKIPKGTASQLLTPPTVEPVTVSQFKNNLRIPESLTTMDATITRLLVTSRRVLEAYTQMGFVSQKWRQIQNVVSRQVELLRRPVLSVDEVRSIPNFDDDTEVIFPASSYIKSGVDSSKPSFQPAYLLARSTWPTHRGWKSFIIEFTVGFGTTADAVPQNIQDAILLYAGHLYENPEGEGEGLKSLRGELTGGNIPADVTLLLEEYMLWRV